MKKLLAIVLALMLCGAAAVADVAVDEANFPDEAFREVMKAFDKDGDGTLSDGETKAVEDLECGELGIQSVKGLELFPNLKSLSVHDNQLTGLDVSACPKLKELVETIDRVTRNFDSGSMDCFEGDDIGCWMFVDESTRVIAGDTVSEKSVRTE